MTIAYTKNFEVKTQLDGRWTQKLN